MKTQKVWKAEDIIGLVPDELLDNLTMETGVDYSVQKLHGKTIFKLFLYAFLSGSQISLRLLEHLFKSQNFRALFTIKPTTIKHSAFSMRLNHIKADYFEKIFLHLIHSPKLDSVLFDRKKVSVSKIDTTIVTLSSKLLRFGLDDNKGYKTLKFGVTIKASIPVQVICMSNNQRYLSEDNALPPLIYQTKQKNALNIAIFDRGVQRKQNFANFNKEHIYFISRLSTQKVAVAQELPLVDTETPTLTVLRDQMITFANKDNLQDRDENTIFRLVTGRSKETGQEVKFLTNVDFLNATEIANLYKSRWEIETFFKFIKQQLNFNHLLSRNENGIKVVMYLTMIAAILLTLYKQFNNIMGWAIAKLKFLDELFSNTRDIWQHGFPTYPGLQAATIKSNSS